MLFEFSIEHVGKNSILLKFTKDALNYSSTDGVGYNQSFTNNSGIYPQASSDDRFFFAPFLVGGLAGTALGYGIANNNQIKGGYYMPPPPIYYYPSPAPYTYNNYYY